MGKLVFILILIGTSMMAGGIGKGNSEVTVAGVVFLAVGLLVGRFWSR